MRKYILLALNFSFYLCTLLVFKLNISVIITILLIFILSFENKYFIILTLPICAYFEGFYILIVISAISLVLIFYSKLRKNRYYHLICFLTVITLTNTIIYIIFGFDKDMLVTSLISLIIYGIVNSLYIFQNKNNTNFIISTNENLITLTLLLGYMVFITLYNPNIYILMFLFMQVYLLKDYKYNILFSISFILLYYILKGVFFNEVFKLISVSYLPLSILLTFDFSNTISYFYILYSLLTILITIKNKDITIEFDYINNLFKDFQIYISDLNKEYERLYSINKIKDSCLENIITTYCNNCTKNTLCNHKVDKRISFIRSSMNNRNNNIYDCPNYDKFYLDSNIDVKTTYEHSAIKELTYELEFLYNQSLKLSENYNKFIKELNFRGYKIDSIDINISDSTLFFSFTLSSKKPIITDLFIKLGCKSFGENLALRVINKDCKEIIYMYKKPKIKLDYSHITLPKNSNIISGDNFYIKKNHNDSYIFALSDGMGSGHQAYIESADTLKLISTLSSYHFSIKTILRLLENIYNLRIDYDKYATLDLAFINTANSLLTLYKLGSTTSFIYHNNSLISYENKSLPLKLDDINSFYEIELFKNDIILLLSDGVTDFLTTDDLLSIVDPSISSTDLMFRIANKVKEKESLLKDDLSIIVIKVN